VIRRGPLTKRERMEQRESKFWRIAGPILMCAFWLSIFVILFLRLSA
jgi:hypothetical protein